MSPSARKVWIEIRKFPQSFHQIQVTFREEGVDWNVPLEASNISFCEVTFREEGVDWNYYVEIAVNQYGAVTFREEGDCVDLRRMKS